jgi:hypothetical protein
MVIRTRNPRSRMARTASRKVKPVPFDWKRRALQLDVRIRDLWGQVESLSARLGNQTAWGVNVVNRLERIERALEKLTSAPVTYSMMPGLEPMFCGAKWISDGVETACLGAPEHEGVHKGMHKGSWLSWAT